MSPVLSRGAAEAPGLHCVVEAVVEPAEVLGVNACRIVDAEILLSDACGLEYRREVLHVDATPEFAGVDRSLDDLLPEVVLQSLLLLAVSSVFRHELEGIAGDVEACLVEVLDVVSFRELLCFHEALHNGVAERFQRALLGFGDVVDASHVEHEGLDHIPEDAFLVLEVIDHRAAADSRSFFKQRVRNIWIGISGEEIERHFQNSAF